MLRQSLLLLSFCTVCLPIAPLWAQPSATLSIEPAGDTVVSVGGTVEYSVFLRDYTPNNPSEPITAFGLNVAASSPVLTENGADFSRFAFVLDPGLNGMLGSLVFDGDISDDGLVQFGADVFPVPVETGILSSTGDIKLGRLSIASPLNPGTFDVGVLVDEGNPLVGGTFLLVDDGSILGLTFPGDGVLTTSQSSLTTIPEPSSISVVLLAGIMILVRRPWLSQGR